MEEEDIGRLGVEAGIRPSSLRGRVTTSIGRSGLIGVMITFNGLSEIGVTCDEEGSSGKLLTSEVEIGFIVVPLITI